MHGSSGTFDLELTGEFDDFVPPYDGDDADEIVGTSGGGLVLFDRREKDGGQKIPRFTLPASGRDVYAQAVHAAERLRLWKEAFPAACCTTGRAKQHRLWNYSTIVSRWLKRNLNRNVDYH